MSAWTVIAHTEVGSGGASNIQFLNVGSIPSTYTDLAILLSVRTGTTSGAAEMVMRFNNSNSGYSDRFLSGSGSSASSGSNGYGTDEIYIGPSNSPTADTFANTLIYIPNYASSNNKSVSIDSVGEANQTAAIQIIIAGLWSNSAAITEIDLFPTTASLILQYSSATLYGITKGSSNGVTVS